MEIKDIVIFVVVVIVAAVIASFIFSPSSDAHDTNIQLLNKGDFGSNSSVYVKLTDTDKNSLSNKTVHVKLLDKKGKVVYDKSTTTHSTGVGIVKLSNVTAGEYTLNVNYDGDANYTGCSLSKKISVEGGEVEDVIDNSTLTTADLQDIADTQAQQQQDSQSSSQSSQSYTPQQSSDSSSSSSSSESSSGYDVYYDENGQEMTPVIDPDGNQVDPED